MVLLLLNIYGDGKVPNFSRDLGRFVSPPYTRDDTELALRSFIFHHRYNTSNLAMIYTLPRQKSPRPSRHTSRFRVLAVVEAVRVTTVVWPFARVWVACAVLEAALRINDVGGKVDSCGKRRPKWDTDCMNSRISYMSQTCCATGSG